MKLEDILPALQAWFKPSEHKDRRLPGGGRWFYISHQLIRDRLNEVCPGCWESEYSAPVVSGDYTVVHCKLTICGITRSGVADDKTFPEVNDSGKSKIIGSPVVNATRHAFRDAAEQFGICAYLDEQKNIKDFMGYMQKNGDGRAAKFVTENGWNGEPSPTNDGPVGRDRLMHDTTQEMKRLGWTEEQGRDYLKRAFAGKETRSKLTNNEMSQFLSYLKSQTAPAKPAPPIGQSAPVKPAIKKPSPQAPEPTSAPETNGNLEWLRSLTHALGQAQKRGDDLIKQAMQIEFEGSVMTADLDVFQRNRVARRVLVLYGEASYPGKAEALCYEHVTNNEVTGSLEPTELAKLWLSVLQSAAAPVG